MLGEKGGQRKVMPNTSFIADTGVANAINAAQTFAYPFCHCIAESVLPESLLKEVHARWPPDTILGRQSDSGRSGTNAYQERFMMVLGQQRNARMTPEEHAFWQTVVQTVAGPKVIGVCFDKFGDVLQKRIGHLGHDSLLDIEVQIVSDRRGYSIGPHTDSKQRLISILYYLSADAKYKEYGTGLYQPKDPERTFKHHIHYDFEDFMLAKQVDYKANRALIFPRTDQSFHGVQPSGLDTCDRRLLIVNIRAPEGAR